MRLSALLLVALLLALAASAGAESLWVRDEVRINVRSEPSSASRVQGLVKSGDRLEVLGERNRWTRIRTRDGTEGWIPGGYLQPEAPARALLAARDRELAELRERVEALQQETRTLRADDAAEDDGGAAAEAALADLRGEVESLRDENRRLRVQGGGGSRGAEWIAGALILGSGMAIGALLARSTGRRSSRIRL